MSPWSSEIMECFQKIKPDLESDFTPAAYNKLLNTLFPVNTPYTVFPQVHRHEDLSTPTARTTFTVYYRNSPVFLLDLHAYPTLSRISARENADDHIRIHVRDLLPFCPLPTLHAMSAFGTRLAFYTASAGNSIMPARMPPTPGQDCQDTTPSDWWDCDLMEDDGAIRLKEVVNKIRNQCENL
ncbi:hypothetical protein JR316_0012398 [Psilocybe cubensis]|uniref:Uncharacterized protein n=2 Tax=Psilocybe cubensis TaxID=181762 RepID=A0ACB8GIR0_PSICU|nr:hypothetical protein JR316_0012398 [Psilocybe cubensis]KAH9475287.1 hypothetical protein JR316_0012398 [Psilocybe cubensis]